MAAVSVVVATYGESLWTELALSRAIPSAEAQGVAVIHEHGESLAEARNAGLARVETEFVIHLDADDELEPGYCAAMLTGRADIRSPRVRAMRRGRLRGVITPRVFGHRHLCSGECLPFGNWIVVGACARAELLRRVGGWEDWPIYEDWALWLRCYEAGATFEEIPEAIYRQHLSPDSRNHAGEAFADRELWHRRIATEILGRVPA